MKDEHQFLNQQAADAHAAMQVTWQRLTHRVKEAGDPRYWVQQHPLAMVATAAAAGFTAAIMAGRDNPPEPARHPVRHQRMAQDVENTGEEQRQKWLIAWGLLKAVIPFLRPLLASSFAAMYAPDPQSNESNGHPSPASPPPASSPPS